MAAEKVSLRRLIIPYTMAVVYGGLLILRMLWMIFTKGRQTFFHCKERKVRPRIMEDPSLGTHGTLNLSKVKLHYVSSGDPDKPLMLLLHGFPECWFSWRFQIKHFSKEYRVVAVDMRGYGESECPKGVENYSIDKLVQDVKEVISILGYEQCVLVAHDWGGIVAFEFVLRHPEMVKKFIVCNIAHLKGLTKVLYSSYQQLMKSWYIFLFQLPYLPELFIRSRDFKLLDLVFNGMKLPNVSRQTVDEDELEAFKYSMSQPGRVTAAVNYYRALLRYKIAKPAMGYDVKVPTLIIWGTEDVALSTSMVHESKPYIPDLKVNFIYTAGHWVQQQEPDKVNQYMQDFLMPTDAK